MSWIGRVPLDLGAEPEDVDVHNPFVGSGLVPDVTEELLASEGPAGMHGQELE